MAQCRILIASLVASAMAFFAGPSQAATFNYDFASGSYNVIGQIRVSNTPDGIFLGAVQGSDILAITGVVSGPGGGPITGLLLNPNQPNPNVAYGFLYDNVRFGPPQYLDTNGVLFTTPGIVWNLWGNGPTDYELYAYGVTDSHGTLTDSPAPTPLPSTWTMLLIGLVGLGFVAHRQSRSRALSAA